MDDVCWNLARTVAYVRHSCIAGNDGRLVVWGQETFGCADQLFAVVAIAGANLCHPAILAGWRDS